MTQTIYKTSREEIYAVPEVAFTDTWTPWQHGVVIDNIDEELGRRGIGLVNEYYDLSKDGKDLFATLTLDINGEDHDLPASCKQSLMLGWRNSMKKRFSLGIVGGGFVYVCSNMGFYGEFKEVRRHDRRLDSLELKSFIHDTVELVITERVMFLDWFQQMTVHQFDKTDVKILTYEAMEKGVLPPSSFTKFTSGLIEEVEAQRDYASGLTAAHFYGGMTRALRGTGMLKLMDRTRSLTRLLGDYTGVPMIAAAVAKPQTLSDLMI